MALNHTFPVATPLQFLRTLQCGQISACPNTATGERLYEFLRERNKEGVVQMLKKENLDKNVVSSMTNQDLEQYIPKVEDGEAAVSLCRKRAVLPLFAPRAKVGFKRLRHKAAPFSRQLYGIGNTNAKRTIKRIELGWMNFDEDDERYKQVRTKSGGGTLPLSIDVGNTMNDIKALAESLFFPDGVSKRNQRLADYSTHIESSQGHVDMTDTVAQAYEKIKGKILRLYLCTTKIREGDVTDHRQSPGDLECVEHVDDET